MAPGGHDETIHSPSRVVHRGGVPAHEGVGEVFGDLFGVEAPGEVGGAGVDLGLDVFGRRTLDGVLGPDGEDLGWLPGRRLALGRVIDRRRGSVAADREHQRGAGDRDGEGNDERADTATALATLAPLLQPLERVGSLLGSLAEPLQSVLQLISHRSSPVLVADLRERLGPGGARSRPPHPSPRPPRVSRSRASRSGRPPLAVAG